MKELPILLTLFFITITIIAVWMFYRASGNRKVFAVVLGWAMLQSIAAILGFFAPTDLMPPRLAFVILPPVVLITVLCLTPAGRKFLDSFDPKKLTLLHIIRTPVEATLYFLYVYGVMPELMTFEGKNFDIISGVTAPFIYYFGYVKRTLSRTVLLAWNFMALGILAFTVFNGLLSAPTPLQQFAFDQPSVAVLHFPFSLLPGIVVPIVYFGHIITIRHHLKLNREDAQYVWDREERREFVPVSQSTS